MAAALARRRLAEEIHIENNDFPTKLKSSDALGDPLLTKNRYAKLRFYTLRDIKTSASKMCLTSPIKMASIKFLSLQYKIAFRLQN